MAGVVDGRLLVDIVLLGRPLRNLSGLAVIVCGVVAWCPGGF